MSEPADAENPGGRHAAGRLPGPQPGPLRPHRRAAAPDYADPAEPQSAYGRSQGGWPSGQQPGSGQGSAQPSRQSSGGAGTWSPYQDDAPAAGAWSPYDGPASRNGSPKSYDSPYDAPAQHPGAPTAYAPPTSYDSPSSYGSSTSNGSPAPYASPTSYGSPNSYGSPAPYGSPASNGTPAPYASPAPYANPGSSGSSAPYGSGSPASRDSSLQHQRGAGAPGMGVAGPRDPVSGGLDRRDVLDRREALDRRDLVDGTDAGRAGPRRAGSAGVPGPAGAPESDLGFGTSTSPLGPGTPGTGTVLPRHATGGIVLESALRDAAAAGVGDLGGGRGNGVPAGEGTRRLTPRRPHPEAEDPGPSAGRLPADARARGLEWLDSAAGPGLPAGDDPGYGPAGQPRLGGGAGGRLPGRPLAEEPAVPPLRGGRIGDIDDGAAGGRGGSGGGSGGDDRGTDSGSGRGRGRRPGKASTPLAAAFGAVTEVVVVVALALILALVIKTFLVQAFFIPSESMEDTLLTGDRVLVSKLTPGVFGLHRGDIIVFKDPGGWLTPTTPPDEGPLRNGVRDLLTFVGLLPQDSGEHLIKRVIGLPGDHVQCCDAKGRVMVNGVAIDEPYLFPGNTPSDKTFDEKVPAGMLWVMGDHRSVSEDSRWHLNLNNGMVPESDVVGRAFVIVWPLGRASTLGVPDSVFARVPDSAPSG